MLPTIVRAVREALKLSYAAIALNGLEAGGPEEVVATAGRPTARPVRLPLVYQREVVGALLLGQRGPGEAFGPADERLLADLGRQAGVAVHAVRLRGRPAALAPATHHCARRRASTAPP